MVVILASVNSANGNVHESGHFIMANGMLVLFRLIDVIALYLILLSTFLGRIVSDQLGTRIHTKCYIRIHDLMDLKINDEPFSIEKKVSDLF